MRHDPDSVTLLSHQQQIERVRGEHDKLKPHFTHEVVVADDDHVVSIWNVTFGVDRDRKLCGIEAFRVRDGRFTDAWNGSYTPGHWGREGDDILPRDLPAPNVLANVADIDDQWLARIRRKTDRPLTPPVRLSPRIVTRMLWARMR